MLDAVKHLNYCLQRRTNTARQTYARELLGKWYELVRNTHICIFLYICAHKFNLIRPIGKKQIDFEKTAQFYLFSILY